VAQFDDGTPIYRQIAEQIEAQILSGALREGEQVMSTNQYAAFYRINPATAAKAFQQLAENGILYKKRGIGMFVAEGAPEQLREERRRRFTDDHLLPLLEEARNLGITFEQLIEQLRSAHAHLSKEKHE